MKYNVARVVPWVGGYALLVLTPLMLAMIGASPAPRSFLVEFGVGLGFVAIALIGLQFVITGRFRSIAPVFGGDVVLQFHRQIGIVATVLIVAHPLLLVIGDPDYLEFLDPRVNLLRALALAAVVPAAVLLMVTSLWRELFRLNYEWWRAGHGVLALAVVFIGMVHGIQVGAYLGEFWKKGIWAGVLCGLMYLVIHTRVVRPALMKRRPYQLVEVRREVADVFTLVLEPVEHVGMRFSAGQYAWMTVGSSPYSMQQHPFSFASSAHSGELTFTSKAVGDFTSSWDAIEPGERVYLEGPFGAFTFDPTSEGAVFIVGGIGVTPAMSVLRTMRDTDDERPVVLVYGNTDLDAVVFRDELDELAGQLDLDIVHVLEEPPGNWDGESGFVDRDLLLRVLPADCRTYEFFVCGPEPLMDAAETALRDIGVTWRQIYTERFQIV